MRLKHLLLTSALSGSLALAPLALAPRALHAQAYEAWVLNREVLNSAANYTGVLTSAHTQVRRYITWQWNTSLNEKQQEARTADILAQIVARQQVGQDLVPSLDRTVLESYGVRLRYCDSTLLSYFEARDFKHGLNAQQIIDAPVLRAERAGATFYGEPLGIIRGDEGDLMLETFGGRRNTPIPACMADAYGGPLAVGTVAYMTSAAQKFGVARVRKRRETRKLPCAAPQVGLGIKQQRFKRTDYNAQNDPLYNALSTIARNPEDGTLRYPYYDTETEEGEGHWRDKVSHCRAPATIPIRQIRDCADGSEGTATYEVFLTEAYDETTAAFREAAAAFNSNTGTYDPDFDGNKRFLRDWYPSDAQGNLTGDATGELIPHLSFCPGAPDSLTLEPVISHRQEERPGICRTPYPRGAVTQARDVEIRTWNLADSPEAQGFDALREVTTEIPGNWAVSDDRCYRNVNERTTETNPSACPAGQTGSVTYQRIKTKTGVDWHWAGWQDQLTTSHTKWTTASTTCKPKPRGGGGGDQGGEHESFDVDGDGVGDFHSRHAAERAKYSGGKTVSGSCGGCNGPSRGPDPEQGSNKGSSGGGGGGGCFLTTAIVERRGEADDGPTLTTLRGFRDTYMAQRPDGPALVAEYYDVAPRIVAAIPVDDPAWDWIGAQVDLAVALIDADDLEGAFGIYTAMVQRLKADWLTPIPTDAPRTDTPNSNDREILQ